MKVEFNYFGGIPPENRSVFLDDDSHKSVMGAVLAARRVGLGVAIFSYSEILTQVPEGQDEIEICATATGTAYEEQLKSMFVADASLSGQNRPNAAVALLKYPDRIDFEKLAHALEEFRHSGRPIGKLRFMSVEKLGIPRGYLGINPECLMVPALFTPSKGESFTPYTDKIPGSWILDESLRELSRFCMLVGYRKADALVVIDGGNGQLGNRLDGFFRNYFEGGSFAIADIRERRKC